jgi:hypothetical protein
MSRVFQNIDPPPPSPPGECVPSAFVAGGGHTRRIFKVGDKEGRGERWDEKGTIEGRREREGVIEWEMQKTFLTFLYKTEQ